MSLPSVTPASPRTPPSPLLALLQKHWGYNAFRPLQEKAINCVLNGQDSLLVLPTGGGKSLCYQLPAVAMEGTAIVVSPLIALMKDQVDSLAEMGIPAGMMASSQEWFEQREVRDDLRAGRLKLLYVSPERLVADSFMELLDGIPISFFAIDEAHCISHWGHDFRPEYRQLSALRARFKKALHGFTATATERVRQDICTQLKLQKPQVIVGDFDRPNLFYRFARRTRPVVYEVEEALKRHKHGAGIVYTIRRKDVDDLVAELRKRGHHAAGYHAGMEADERARVQEDFTNERVNLIVATVAFGMGIDRPDVRFVIHTGMPKSIEHYQQEAGRGGRDGLLAECLLFYTGADLMTWKFIFQKNMTDVRAEKIALQLLNEMYRFADGPECRHAGLVQYFGQAFTKPNCGACDVCVGERVIVPESTTIALKILSGIVRTGERFGTEYIQQHLRGKATERSTQNGHDALSTFGLLKESSAKDVGEWVDQLESQGLTTRDPESNGFKVTPLGWRLLKERNVPVRLLSLPSKEAVAKTTAAKAEEAPIPEDLFEELRALRRRIAEKLKYPPYVIFQDKTLRELCLRQPKDIHAFTCIEGVGESKAKKYGKDFVTAIRRWAEEKGKR